MDAQQQLFGIMTAAEEQQKAIKSALEGLTAERAALAKERAALTQAAATVVDVASDVRKAAADAVPAIQKAAGEAVGFAVKQSLSEASEAAVRALSDATRPVIGSLSAVAHAASEAEGSIRKAGQWFAWKFVGLAAGGLFGVCLVAYASLAWQQQQIKSLGEEKAELAADVAQLQVNVSALEKKGGRIVMNTCGGRLCIEASSNQGASTENKSGAKFVIPKGY